jgi:phosphomannomutase
MADTGAVFGGEHSGHYYFKDNYRADSGILAMLVLLRIISEAERPLSELRTEFEPYAQSGEINMVVADTSVEIERVAAEFEGGDRLDGLTADVGDAWFNLRPSNTEPVLRLNVEASDVRGVEKLVALVRSHIEEVPVGSS